MLRTLKDRLEIDLAQVFLVGIGEGRIEFKAESD